MKLNRKEHNRFIQWLDRTAETNPFLWLPCVLMIVLALAGESIAEYVKTAHDNSIDTEKTTQLKKKPFALRAVAMSLVMAFSFMIVPEFSFDVFAVNIDDIREVRTAYIDKLTDVMDNSKYFAFDVYDMDGDEIDELFIAYKDDTDAEYTHADVFTYSYADHEVKALGKIGLYGDAVMLNGKYLLSYNEWDIPSISVKKGNKLVCIRREYFAVRNDLKTVVYEVDGEEVTSDEYREAMAPFVIMERESVGIRYSLDNNAIETILGPDSYYDHYDAMISNNVGDNDYINFQRWTDQTYSYLSELADGTMERVEYIQGIGVVVERYSKNKNVIFQKIITPTLPIFGGAFIGRDNNFLVFGQNNPEEDNNVEVMQVVKYSKDWKRLGSISIKDENTTVPFDGGSLRMAETDDLLIIHTCHEMYESSDGHNHQANMTFVINKPDMSINNKYSGVMDIPYGYVSHSFNQFVKTDGTYIYRLDHGDASTRAVVLTKAPVTDVTSVGNKHINVLDIKGNKGDNDTGVSVGGFEMSAYGFIVAGNTVDQNDSDVDRQNDQRNIFISVVNVVNSDLSDARVSTKYLTDYSSGVALGNPLLVKINNKKFVVLWEETTGKTTDTRFVTVDFDEQGNAVTSAPTTVINARLSDCQPVLTSDGNITWYYTKKSAPIFVTIDENGQRVDTNTHFHDYGREWQEENSIYHYLACKCGKARTDGYVHVRDYGVVTLEPTAVSEGEMTYSCIVCGKVIDKEIIPVIDDHEHIYDKTVWSKDRYNHWHECSCGDKIDVAEHDFDDGEVMLAPVGITADVITYTCKECGYFYIEATEHDYDTTVWKHDDFDHWHECLSFGDRIDAAEHTFDDGVITVEPTETTTGVMTYTCEVCGYSTTEVIPLLEHEHSYDTVYYNYVDHWAQCSCGEKIDLGEHEFVEVETDEDVENDEGINYECSLCKYRCILKNHEHDYVWRVSHEKHFRKCSDEDCCSIVDCAKHNFDDGKITTEPTEATTGVMTYTCKGCGHSITKVVPVLEHNYDTTVWKNNGYRHWHECTNLNCIKKTDAAAHNFGDVEIIIEPTEMTMGIKKYTCSDCGYFYKEIIPVKDHEHNFNSDWHSDATGHWHSCTLCGEETEKIAHNFDSGVTTAGVITYTCSVCKYSYKTTIPPEGHTHNYGTKWQSDSTGHWYECTCGDKIDFAAHISDGGKITVSPTSITNGVRTYSCSVCGYVMNTVTIPATGDVNVSTSSSTSTSSSSAIVSMASSQKQPYISDDSSIDGWDRIAAYINASAEGAVIPISMNGENELPKNIVECIQNRNVTLEINMTSGDVWTVNGFDVTAPKNVNLRVSSKSNKVPKSVIEGLNSELKAKEYRLYNNKNYGFTAQLTLNVENKYNEHYAELYHYNTKTQQLEFVDESYVSNRQVTFNINNASYYVIAFNSLPLYDDVSSGAGVFEDLVPIETSTMPETNGVTIPAIKLPQIMKCSNKKRRYRILKKRRLDDMVFVY